MIRKAETDYKMREMSIFVGHILCSLSCIQKLIYIYSNLLLLGHTYTYCLSQHTLQNVRINSLHYQKKLSPEDPESKSRGLPSPSCLVTMSQRCKSDSLRHICMSWMGRTEYLVTQGLQIPHICSQITKFEEMLYTQSGWQKAGSAAPENRAKREARPIQNNPFTTHI